VIAQHVKSARVPLRYPCIIYSSSKHRVPNYPRKIEVQNIFQTKPNITTTLVTKSPKLDNVPVNVVVVVTTRSQTLEQ
jgi:hypothetical protein